MCVGGKQGENDGEHLVLQTAIAVQKPLCPVCTLGYQNPGVYCNSTIWCDLTLLLVFTHTQYSFSPGSPKTYRYRPGDDCVGRVFRRAQGRLLFLLGLSGSVYIPNFQMLSSAPPTCFILTLLCTTKGWLLVQTLAAIVSSPSVAA